MTKEIPIVYVAGALLALVVIFVLKSIVYSGTKSDSSTTKVRDQFRCPLLLNFEFSYLLKVKLRTLGAHWQLCCQLGARIHIFPHMIPSFRRHSICSNYFHPAFLAHSPVLPSKQSRPFNTETSLFHCPSPSLSLSSSTIIAGNEERFVIGCAEWSCKGHGCGREQERECPSSDHSIWNPDWNCGAF